MSESVDLGHGHVLRFVGWKPDRTIPEIADRFKDVPDDGRAGAIVTHEGCEALGFIGLNPATNTAAATWTVVSWDPRYQKLRVAARVAWELHYGSEAPDDLYVCHHCDNPQCVRPDHLFLGTNSDNQQDALAKGRRPPLLGSRVPSAKLDENKVQQIRSMIRRGVMYGTIARSFGVGRSTIEHIANRTTWGWLPEAMEETSATEGAPKP